MPYASQLDIYIGYVEMYLEWAGKMRVKYGCPVNRPFDQYELSIDDYKKLLYYYNTLATMEKDLALTPSEIKQVDQLIEGKKYERNTVVS